MSRAFGISRHATTFARSPFTHAERQSYTQLACRCPSLRKDANLLTVRIQAYHPSIYVYGVRFLSGTSAPKKRHAHVAHSVKKTPAESFRTRRGSASGSAAGAAIAGAKSGSVRPGYLNAPTVSAKEMVLAIESSRQSIGSAGAKKSSKLDPFGKAADPFANQLEAAIEASKKTDFSGGWKDSRYDRANTRSSSSSSAGEINLPDIQAQYLVGSATWESICAKDVTIKNVTPRRMPKVAELEHGLDRVLFNPGVHWLQDPRSAVFNFDPYLRSICQPEDFDYTALPEYKTSSRDTSLLKVASANKGKYLGSTSSMTSVLSQFYYLISAWKPLKTNHLSGAFAAQPKGFTRLSRAPSTIQLVYKGNGIYAIDADKTFDSSTVLMQLGKSMEKMLTSTPEEFSRFTKKNSWKVSRKERSQPEAFNYIAVDNFLLRSQLDCEDPRLPGKTFDLKTRAAVAIRLDVHNYELNQGYQLRKAHGYLESFEREYYDMMRSAFLKYSLQVRIGQMDGIFVAFHNTAKIFGFQYISLDEMDSRLFGSSVMGDESFRNQLRLLNRTLDEITKKYPEQDLKITVDTDESVQSMNVWVETMPLGAASSNKGKDVKIVFDENGAPEMQEGAELSLWQVVCYSTINGVETVDPFDLSERGTDNWMLRYKIAELKKPHMMNEYRRMKAIQAEILSQDDEKEVAEAAAAAARGIDGIEPDTEVKVPTKREMLMAAKRDAMRSTLRRISEQGKVDEENQERLQGDKKLLVWEPKGYVKTATLKATKKDAKIEQVEKVMKDKEEEEVVATTSRVEAAAEKMRRKLAGAMKYATMASTSELASEATNSDLKEKEAISGAATKVTRTQWPDLPFKSQAWPIYYRRFRDNSSSHIPGFSLFILRQSIMEPEKPLSEDEKSALERMYKEHGELAKSLSRFDNVRFDLIQVPGLARSYENMARNQMEHIAKLIKTPAQETESDEELQQRLSKEAPPYRSRLVLDYFYNHMHKVMYQKEDASPFRNFEDYLAIEDEALLIRGAKGMAVTARSISGAQAANKFPKKEDSIKKAVATQLFYHEQMFSDEALKEMGFYPRLFDKTKYKITADIMKDRQPEATRVKEEVDLGKVQSDSAAGKKDLE